MKRIKVILVDDHPFTRAGVRAILETNKAIEVIDEAVDGNDAIVKVIDKRPDIVVMDITMPNLSGIDATREIVKLRPDVKIIALSIHSGENFVNEMIEAGAVGYLLKDEAPEELLRAIEKVDKGEMFLSSGVTRVALSKPKKEEGFKGVNILQTKLNRPQNMDDYVVRTKIVETLERNISKPLSIVSAAAGYGKSISISQWLEHSRALHCWISLDEEHNDLRVFVCYLYTAIEKIIPDSLEKTKDLLLEENLPAFRELSYTLINELSQIDQEFIVVLDDFHMIHDEEVHQLMDEWLRFPPQKVHLSIITRVDPPLSLSPLRIKDRMIEIRMEDLCFAENEIADLFNNTLKINLNEQTLEFIYQKTEGWIISLRLVSMIIKGQEDADRVLKSIKGGWQSISAYLIAEVLEKQSESIQNQLIDSSILNIFNSELLDEIAWMENTGGQKVTNGNELIQWLIKTNMFVVELDSGTNRFRYRHLFRDLLQNEFIKRRAVAQRSKIHTKASNWFEKNDFFTEAIEHAIKANNVDRAIGIVVKHWESTFDKNLWQVVEDWLALIQEEEADDTNNLLFARLWVAIRRNKVDVVQDLVEWIEQNNLDLNEKETGYLAFAKGQVCLEQGTAEEVLKYAEKALSLIPKKHAFYSAEAKGLWTLAMQLTGQSKKAILAVKKDLKEIDISTDPIQASFRIIQGNSIYITNANLPELKTYTTRFFKIPEISRSMMGFGAYFSASVCWWAYDLEGAANKFESSINYKHKSPSHLSVDSYIGRALALQELSRLKEATDTINLGFKFAENSSDPDYSSFLDSGRARLNLLKGNLQAAEEWLDSTKFDGLKLSMLWWLEVPAITRCRVLIAKETTDSLNEAIKLLKDYREYSESVFNNLRTIEIVLLQVQANLKIKDESKAIADLEYALDMAAAGGWIRPFVEVGIVIHGLLKQLKEKSVHLKFIEQILGIVEKKNSSHIRKSTQETEHNEMIPFEKQSIFTHRELEVLKYVSQGLRNKEIADKLFISNDAIKKHLYKMFQKLEVNNRINLITKAKKMGF
jgi:LuxR family maltose regulon positive regulatory protein